ncbi:MAG: Gfo/Idh/MocA family oxidoreductase [Marinosulfonomonas sp.]|nr:Gfo/Idh/MocA family oxidoreductase [Marinosulfonomonas sp.]
MQRTDEHVGVAIIGAGERGVYYIGSRIAETVNDTELLVVGVFDLIEGRARLAAEHLNQIYQTAGISHRTRVFSSLDQAVGDAKVDLVVVTTHTNNHREPVAKAVAAGKRVYLDKPISVTLDDAQTILDLEKSSGQPIIMGFTRRYEKPWITAVDLAQSGRIGGVRMVLLRSVIPYSRYMQLWHRDASLSGGAINDKCSHHFDVLNWISNGATPIRVSAAGGRSGVFGADPDAPERCSDCDRDCPYRRHETLIDKFEGVGTVPNESWVHADNPRDRNDTCVYHPGADIDDHAVITVQFDSGLVATVFFAIFGPWSEDQETLEIVGDSGRLRMERHSGDIDLVENYGHDRSVIKFDNPNRSSSHYGADLELVQRLRGFMNGETPPVGPREGVSSLRLVLAAQASLRDGGRLVDLTSEDLA